MPAAHRLLRLLVAAGYEDELLAFARDAGLGTGVAVREFPAGLLADEPEPSGGELELRLYVAAGALEPARAALRAWAANWGEPGPRLRFLGASPVDLSEDPEQAWQSRWRPFRCAGFAVVPEFLDPRALPLRPGDLLLRTVAGSAFGSGGHATTRMALRAARQMWESRRPARWLDVGTGSGILAVAAARLGAAEAAGMDPEAASPPQTLRMAALNGVGGRVLAWRGTLRSARGRWPAVLANLFADLLADEAPALASLVERGGLLYSGGIVDRRWEAARAALEGAGLRLEALSARGRWRGAIWRAGETGND